MTPQQELANFLHDRGTCLHANGKLVEARAAFAESLRLEPRSANAFTALLVACGVNRMPIHSLRNSEADDWSRQFMVPEPQPGLPQIPQPSGILPMPAEPGLRPAGGPKNP
jgi:hypothetical protein